ncbi:MAG: FadR family transcriptional regulator [Desulfofustis sp.]|nr:FadR family transcriptional regulator [Desulfofustis sp.]NNK57597.1 FadR family transcriptional regulator [Desulfofustis sp.]
MVPFGKMPLAKYKSKGVIIAEQILAKIKSGEYASGSKLPAERLIAEQVGASRPSVREAISALHIVGIIERHPGDGNYISSELIPDDLSLHLQATRILEESDSPYEILQARKVVETGSARLAIREASDQDINKITSVWEEKYQIGLAGDYQAYTRLGKKLHLAIAEATQNRIIISMVDRLLDISTQPLWQNMRRLYYEKDPIRIDQMLDIHDRIVRAIQHRNSHEAILALEADFDTVLEQLYSMNGREG